MAKRRWRRCAKSASTSMPARTRKPNGFPTVRGSTRASGNRAEVRPERAAGTRRNDRIDLQSRSARLAQTLCRNGLPRDQHPRSARRARADAARRAEREDGKSSEQGKSGSVRVELGGHQVVTNKQITSRRRQKRVWRHVEQT